MTTPTRSSDPASNRIARPSREAEPSVSALAPQRAAQPETRKPVTTAHEAASPVASIAAADRAAARMVFGLDRGDRQFVTLASILALVLMSVHWWRITTWTPAPVRVDRPAVDDYRFVLDINRATWVEWMQVEGIGETLARRIVANREEFGGFPDVDALLRVPGVGEKTLEKIRAHAIIDWSATAVEAERRSDES